MIIEICANSYQSARNAQEAGADRIELCSELAVGGLTPSYGLLKKVTEELTIPTHVLIRPRSGDFTYTDTEFEIMKQNIELCKELGCVGIVSGVLHNDNTLDLKRTQELVELAKPMSFTFHRAFDWVQNPVKTAQILAKIGVHRILTSGQEVSAAKGIDLLKQLNQQSDLIILPGGGINKENVYQFKEAGFKEIHLSASKTTQTINPPKVSMNSSKHFDETLSSVSDKVLIQEVVSLLKN